MSNPGIDYYDGPELVEGLATALADAELDLEALQIDDLAALDEFHALGRAATVALAELAGLAAGDRVIDVGAGIGGPARVLAARYGAHVTAVDATPRFCRAAEMLTRGTRLDGQVRVVCGDALDLPFADGGFDLAWTQAVSQNIADKPRFVAELARVVRPGGRVAMFELLAGPGGPVQLPVPWADESDQSLLFAADELRELLDSGPLMLTTWREGPALIDAIARAGESLGSPPSDPRVGLHLLMPDYDERMASVARNIADQRFTLVQAIATRR
jgi:SAM-dependent methyltransferase